MVRLLRRNGSQRGLEKPAAAIAGSRLDETIGDSGGRLHVSRSGSKQKTGARAKAAIVLFYSGVGVESARRTTEQSVGRGKAGKHCGFPEAPDLLISTSQRASAPAASGTHPKNRSSWPVAARDLGTTAFTAPQLGENCGDRPLQWRVGHQLCWCPPKLGCDLPLMTTRFHHLFCAVNGHLWLSKAPYST
jgi:hypothetical protein